MNREEAAEFTRKLLARAETIVFPKTPKTINHIPVFYFEAVLSALRGPQPDPITGLVLCGCGGRPYIEQDDDYYMGGWRVDCPECEIWVPCFKDKDTLVKTWNTAMGWKGGAE